MSGTTQPIPVHTSSTHPLRIDTIESSHGNIGLTFCPGKKGPSWSGAIQWDRNLEADIKALVAYGATHVVTLIEPFEFQLLKVSLLPQAMDDAGFVWHHLPIVDGQAPGPQFLSQWPDAKKAIIEALHRGESVVVHCRGGLGRAGLVGAALIKTLHPERHLQDVIDQVRTARPGAIETPAQEEWLQKMFQDHKQVFAHVISQNVDKYLSGCCEYRTVCEQDDATNTVSPRQDQLVDELDKMWQSLSASEQDHANHELQDTHRTHVQRQSHL